jgi:putative peptide zinc metalloprotease protein
MADPAKLELLTRTGGELGFQLHEVESSQAHVLFKPKRLPASEWEITPQPRSPDGSRNFTLRGFTRDRYLLLSPREKFLWDLFDGDHSLTEIGRAFHFQFGSFDYALIREFLAKLYHAGLLEEIEVSSGFQRAFRDRKGHWWKRVIAYYLEIGAKFSLRLTRADRYCTAIYRRGGFVLFHPVAFWLVVMLTAVALGAVFNLAPQAREISMRLTQWPVLTAVLIVALLPVVSMLHVLVHALACKSYGRRVREMGFFLLQGILPTFYADVTDIFMSSRRARVIVDLAGPLVEVALGSLAFVGAYAAPPGLGQSLLFGAGILLWEGAVINLYPFTFLELDGYNILADLLAMPTLRRQALALGGNLPVRLRAGKALHRSEWIQLGYLALCFISVIAYVIAHLDVIGIDVRAWRFKP